MQHMRRTNQAQITNSRQEFQKVAKCNIVSRKITAHTKAWDVLWYRVTPAPLLIFFTTRSSIWSADTTADAHKQKPSRPPRSQRQVRARPGPQITRPTVCKLRDLEHSNCTRGELPAYLWSWRWRLLGGDVS